MTHQPNVYELVESILLDTSEEYAPLWHQARRDLIIKLRDRPADADEQARLQAYSDALLTFDLATAEL